MSDYQYVAGVMTEAGPASVALGSDDFESMLMQCGRKPSFRNKTSLAVVYVRPCRFRI